MERDSLHTAGDEAAIALFGRRTRFDVVMRGYDRRQVDERVSLLRGRALDLERLEAAQRTRQPGLAQVETSRRAVTRRPRPSSSATTCPACSAGGLKAAGIEERQAEAAGRLKRNRGSGRSA